MLKQFHNIVSVFTSIAGLKNPLQGSSSSSKVWNFEIVAASVHRSEPDVLISTDRLWSPGTSLINDFNRRIEKSQSNPCFLASQIFVSLCLVEKYRIRSILGLACLRGEPILIRFEWMLVLSQCKTTSTHEEPRSSGNDWTNSLVVKITAHYTSPWYFNVTRLPLFTPIMYPDWIAIT